MKNKSFGTSGLTMIEMMVALGVLSVGSLGVLTLVSESNKQNKMVSDTAAINAHHQFLTQSLGMEGACTALVLEADLPVLNRANTADFEHTLVRYCDGANTGRPNAPGCSPRIPNSQNQPSHSTLFPPVIGDRQANLKSAAFRSLTQIGQSEWSSELVLTYAKSQTPHLDVVRRIPLGFRTQEPPSGGDDIQVVGCTGALAAGQGLTESTVCEQVMGGTWDENQNPRCLITRLAFSTTRPDANTGLNALPAQGGLYVQGAIDASEASRFRSHLTVDGQLTAYILRASASISAPTIYITNPEQRTGLSRVLARDPASQEIVEVPVPSGGGSGPLPNHTCPNGQFMREFVSGAVGCASPPSGGGGSGGGGGASITLAQPSTCPAGQMVSGLSLNGTQLSVQCQPQSGARVERRELTTTGGFAPFSFTPDFVMVHAFWNSTGNPNNHGGIVVIKQGETRRYIFHPAAGNSGCCGYRTVTMALTGTTLSISAVTGVDDGGFTFDRFDIVGFKN